MCFSQERKLAKVRRAASIAHPIDASMAAAVQPGIGHSIKIMLTNRYLFLFVIAWVCLHLGLGAFDVLGIVAKKAGYSAVAANLFTTPVYHSTSLTFGHFLADAYRDG